MPPRTRPLRLLLAALALASCAAAPAPEPRAQRSANLSHITGTSRTIQMFLKNRYLQLMPDGTVNGTTDHHSVYKNTKEKEKLFAENVETLTFNLAVEWSQRVGCARQALTSTRGGSSGGTDAAAQASSADAFVLRPNSTAIFQRATYRVGLLTIQGVSTCLYLCMDACGYQYAHKDLSDDCVFEEHIEENNYNTYSRIRAGKKTYLALDNRGCSRRTQIPVGRPLGNLSKYALTLTTRWEGPKQTQCPPRRHRGKLKVPPRFHSVRRCQERLRQQNLRHKRKHKKANDSKKKRHPKTRRKHDNGTTTTTTETSWDESTMSTMSTTTDVEFFRSAITQEAGWRA